MRFFYASTVPFIPSPLLAILLFDFYLFILGCWYFKYLKIYPRLSSSFSVCEGLLAKLFKDSPPSQFPLTILSIKTNLLSGIIEYSGYYTFTRFSIYLSAGQIRDDDSFLSKEIRFRLIWPPITTGGLDINHQRIENKPIESILFATKWTWFEGAPLIQSHRDSAQSTWDLFQCLSLTVCADVEFNLHPPKRYLIDARFFSFLLNLPPCTSAAPQNPIESHLLVTICKW